METKEYNNKYYYSHQAKILAQKRAYQKANPEKMNERNRKYYHSHEEYRIARREAMRKYKREWRLLKEYGLTEEKYIEILNSQDNKCAVCKTSEWGGKNNVPHIDHDHITGKVRGILCGKCNRGLGTFQDSIELLSSAIVYLSNI